MPAAAARTTAPDLADAILIKDNHVAVAGGVGRRPSAAARAAHPHLHVEAEVDTLEQLDDALAARRRQRPARQHERPPPCAQRSAARPAAIRLEASGGITLETVRAIAETGVDAISVGALTHSVRALDISLEVHPCPR